jgi:hypothetical protein
VAWYDSGDRVVIFRVDLKGDEPRALTFPADLIWRTALSSNNLDELVETVADLATMMATSIRQDVNDFLEHLVAEEWLVEVPAMAMDLDESQ